MAEDHTNECRYYVTGSFKDCDCKPKEPESEGHWSKEPFVRLDAKGNVIGEKDNGR